MNIEKEFIDEIIPEFIHEEIFWEEEKLYTEILETEKEEKKFISSCSKIIRNSLEYRRWIRLIKEELNLGICFITGEDDEKTPIEIHHYPLTLYDIIIIILNNLLEKEEKVTTFMIAEEVMKLHFMGKVGFIPLIESIHKKIHKNELLPPLTWVKGDWQYIINNYDIPEEIKEKIEKIKTVSINFRKINWPE